MYLDILTCIFADWTDLNKILVDIPPPPPHLLPPTPINVCHNVP